MKTMVTAAHERGPMQNGEGGCNARWGHEGLCPGHALAAWLNGLGEDDAAYLGEGKPHQITNGAVRMNWIRDNAHIVAVDRRLADLHDERRRLHQQLSRVNRAIRDIERSNRGASAGTRNHVDA